MECTLHVNTMLINSEWFLNHTPVSVWSCSNSVYDTICDLWNENFILSHKCTTCSFQLHISHFSSRMVWMMFKVYSLSCRCSVNLTSLFQQEQKSVLLQYFVSLALCAVDYIFGGSVSVTEICNLHITILSIYSW